MSSAASFSEQFEDLPSWMDRWIEWLTAPYEPCSAEDCD